MKHTHSKLAAAVALLAIAFGSAAYGQTTGPADPQGPKGETGAQGAKGETGAQGAKGAGIVVNNEDGTATIAEDTDSTKAATVYTKDKADALLSTKANSDDVYTKEAADTAAQTKANTAKSEAIEAAKQDATSKVDALEKGTVATNSAAVESIQNRLKARSTGNKRADGEQRANTEPVASLHATGGTDDKSEITVSKSEVAVTRGDGKVVFDADNDAQGSQTTIRGGTATTALILDDQDRAGANTRSGANFGSTIYTDNAGTEAAPAAGFNDASYIALGGKAATTNGTVSTTNAVDGMTYFTATNKPAGAPANAIGVMRETVNGVTKYKYITGTRVSGVGDGVNAYDAVNKGQLDSVDQRLSQGIAANAKRIDGNTQGIANVTAMASMPALPAGAESGFTAGVGSYNGKNAVAIGFQHRLSANTTFKVAAATGSNGKPAVGTGVSYAWGGPTQAVRGQSQQVVALQDQLRAQGTTIAAQAAETAELKRQQAAEKAAQAAETAELKQRMAALMAQVAKLTSK
jgi:hypothetical protein